jgi:predicted DNA-binding protein (MmcQ/YjbR family)
MTPAQFRKAALALEGAVEESHMDHPDFRVHGKIFAGLNREETEGTLKLTPEIQATLDDAFAPAAGAWGQKGWTKVFLKQANVAVVKTLLEEAWKSIPAKKTRATASAKRRSPRRPSSR